MLPRVKVMKTAGCVPLRTKNRVAPIRRKVPIATRFGIGHATVQVEAGDPAHPCALAPAEVL